MAIVNQPRSYQSWVNIAATPGDFNLDAGQYGLAATATFGGGNLQLQKLIPDGNSPATTYVNVGASITAAGYTTYQLPAGQYRLAVTTATAIFAELSKIDTGRAR